MKNLSLVLVIVLALVAHSSFAQNFDEGLVRALDEAEREAMLKQDTATLSQLLSPRIVVQNPENAIIGFSQIMERIKDGKINYTSFERTIEKISFFDNISIVMGKEVVVPKAPAVNADKTVARRFTNIWMKTKEGWKLMARQATIVSIQ
jgi:hypothetical protein